MTENLPFPFSKEVKMDSSLVDDEGLAGSCAMRQDLHEQDGPEDLESTQCHRKNRLEEYHVLLIDGALNSHQFGRVDKRLHESIREAYD